MKVSLVVPNIGTHIHEDTFEPLGVLYIASQICRDHDVQIVDAFNRKLTREEALKEILSFNPDVVGISLTMSPTAPFARSLAQALKRQNRELPIVVGGTHATFAGKQLVAEPQFDVVVLHEGEHAFIDILRSFEGKGHLADIQGILFREDGRTVETPKSKPIADVDSLAFPARQLLPDHKIYNRTHVLSSRGCVYQCIYCASSAMNRYRWRARTPANVLKEVELVASQYTRTFYFADDNFPVNRRRTVELCKVLADAKLDVQWECLSRLEFMDDANLLEIMARGGCREIFIGAESGSARVLEKMKRRYTPEDLKRITQLCRRMGIATTVSFIIGNPYEELDDVKRTLDLAGELCTPNVAFHIFTPYVGTQAYDHPEEFGLEILSDNPEEYDKNKEPVIRTKSLSKEQIMDLYCQSFGISLRKARQRIWLS